MTNNDEGSKLEAMGEPLIELTAPDGTVMRFRFGAVIPLDDIEYAVLLEMEDNPDGEEQVLVTRIEPTDDGGMTFVVEENPQKVEQVFNSYVNLRTQEGLLSVALLRCVSFTLARMKNSRRILAHSYLEIV